MGFSSINDLSSKLTIYGRVYRSDFYKLSLVSPLAYGTYDLAMCYGYPNMIWYGNRIHNSGLRDSAYQWTMPTGWSWASTYMAKAAGTANSVTQTASQTIANSTAYSTAFTVSSRTAGSFTMNVGGTAGTARSANGIYRENITSPASTTQTIGIAALSTSVGRVNDIQVQRPLVFMPYYESMEGSLYHGGVTDTGYKHLLNYGVTYYSTNLSAGTYWLIDVIGVYPIVSLTSTSTQTFNNTATLPRYTTGEGVRAYLIVNELSGTGTQYVTMSYTNQDGVSGRSLGAPVLNTPSTTPGCISHSGAAAYNCTPFLPLQNGDTGIRSVQSITMSAASTAGTATLVLCRPITSVYTLTSVTVCERDYVNQLPSLPRIYDGAFLSVLKVMGGTESSSRYLMSGFIEVGW